MRVDDEVVYALSKNRDKKVDRGGGGHIKEMINVQSSKLQAT
jgi:hypothetical protein